MTIDPSALRDEALRLPERERARLAADLLRSLDDDDDVLSPDEHEAAWGAEIATRLGEIETGAVTPVPWAEARKRIGED